MKLRAGIFLLIALAFAIPAGARTKLAALPERGEVSIRFDNPLGTLIEEERVLTLQEGINLVDFSWRGVTVDPDSIRIAFRTHPEGVKVLSAAYPPGEPSLVWRISSGGAWEEKVRISYLLSNIDRLIAYRGLVSRDEKTLDLAVNIVLRNFSGEDFDLAAIDPGGGKTFNTPTRNEETRQIRVMYREKIPLTKILTWDAAKKPWEPSRLETDVGIPVEYEIANDAPSGLGSDVLWDGKMRVYQDDGRGGTIFLGEDRAELTPVGKKLRIAIGQSRDVRVTQRKTRDLQTNPRPSARKVALYDTEEEFTAEVENFKDEPVTLEIIEHVPGEWKMNQSSVPWEKRDNNTILMKLELKPKAKTVITFGYSRKNVRR